MGSTLPARSSSDVEGEGQTVTAMSKLDVAKQVICTIIDALKPQEQVAIVLFDDNTQVLLPLIRKSKLDLNSIKEKITKVETNGGTDLAKGLKAGIAEIASYLDGLKGEASENNNHRILLLTDANPTHETSEALDVIADQAAKGQKIYVSYVGIGLDFNTDLVSTLVKVRGTNYFAVHSNQEFKKILNEDFNYIVTPLCFNIRVHIETGSFQIDKIFGASQSEQNTAELLHVATVMASAKDTRGIKGGLVLLKLKSVNSNSSTIKVTLSYETVEGSSVTRTYSIDVAEAAKAESSGDGTVYTNIGIRKGVLLARYMDVMHAVIADAGVQKADTFNIYKPSQNIKSAVQEFKSYFHSEFKLLQDNKLMKELELLDKVKFE
jgi:Ca-activated chloride channel family protein